jgi:hypothetical protein
VSAAFRKIWKDFYENRNGQKGRWNRTFKLEKVAEMMDTILGYKWEEELLIYDDPKGEYKKFSVQID